MSSDMKLEIQSSTNPMMSVSEPLDVRVQKFKNDPENMRDVNDFLDDIVEKARIEAESRQAKRKNRLMAVKKIGASIHKAKTSARTFATKVFTAICNCTNTFKTVVANRN